MGTCNYCGRDILWTTSNKGKPTPIDARPTAFYVADGNGGYQQTKGHLCHWASCPQAGTARTDQRRREESTRDFIANRLCRCDHPAPAGAVALCGHCGKRARTTRDRCPKCGRSIGSEPCTKFHQILQEELQTIEAKRRERMEAEEAEGPEPRQEPPTGPTEHGEPAA